MNFRRGLIRLWVFVSVLWIFVVGSVAIMLEMQHTESETQNPYAKYVAPVEPDTPAWAREQAPHVQPEAPAWAQEQPARPTKPSSKGFTFDEAMKPPQLPEWMKGALPVEVEAPKGPSTVPDWANRGTLVPDEPEKPEARKSWSLLGIYVGAAFGVPITLLGFGAGVWWVAIGFKPHTDNAKPDAPS